MGNSGGQRVLVTGASGFVGGRLVRRLVERGWRVSCLVRADSRVDELRSAGAAFITGDVTDSEGVRRALAEARAGTVFHLAGLVRAVDRGNFERVNVGGVENVAAASAACADPPVLVVVSSLAAVGPGAGGCERSEGDVGVPVSDYGRSKLAGEQVAAKYAGAVPITIVRPPVVFGPGDRGVLEIFRPIARWGIHVVPGLAGGERRLSLVYVDDLVDGLLLAAEKGERLREGSLAGQGTYFIAGAEHLTFKQLGEAIAKALGQRPPSVVRVPDLLVRLAGMGGDAVARVRKRPVWMNSDKVTEALAGSWTCSSAKARVQLGWPSGSDATVSLAHRLHETAQWYRQAGWL